ncbi:MAG: RpiR family transcriptional regulator [Candidatus Dactylopiibacterium carminicum]|uniref:RpiR family transcriptional regulator n=1 Tax=Candidatus Dactylopiibacterium carminicum TaxID=857335 RepID=A0A272EN98_9RHOO|nr:MurR/RpiR family transcriptional regulator [Candidatus Dactylopiibacterium carminicum]PAS91572.1 MAG: RpiR family transcriptional regulator [Candidatus Dactylopiibacterium carminicum]
MSRKPGAIHFFRRLGFEDFSAFREHLRQQRVPSQSPLSQIDHADAALAPHLLRDAQRLTALAAQLSEAAAQEASQHLARARRVWVMGYRNSFLAAFYAHALLSQLRGGVQLLNDATGQEAERLAEIGAQDVLLVIDFRRRTRRLQSVVRAASQAGARVLLLTDSAISSLAVGAGTVLACPRQDEQVFDSYVAAVSLVNHLATCVAGLLHGKARARLAAIEQLHAALNDIDQP